MDFSFAAIASWMRLLAFSTIRSVDIAMHVYNADQTPENISKRTRCAVTEDPWQTQQISEDGLERQDYGQLELSLDGSALWYFQRREALRGQRAAGVLAGGRSARHSLRPSALTTRGQVAVVRRIAKPILNRPDGTCLTSNEMEGTP